MCGTIKQTLNQEVLGKTNLPTFHTEVIYLKYWNLFQWNLILVNFKFIQLNLT
jgi:hypothetical protein